MGRNVVLREGHQYFPVGKGSRAFRTYVARIVSLSNLTPCIVEDIVNGRIPDGLSLAQMQNLPDDWQEQCRLLGFSFRPTGI